jgi:thiosulfate/3-mercaptopyruvate sulfurtransferase
MIPRAVCVKLPTKKSYKNYPDDSLVISIEEASKLIGKQKVVFLDTRNYWKYIEGHIPGAYNLELYAFHWVDTSKEGVSAFVKQMENLLGSFGINKQTEVIFYQNNSGYDAARGVWLLNFLGHKKARLLDGGLNLWRRRKLPVSTKDPRSPRRRKFSTIPDGSMIATLGMLSLHMERFQVIDTRSPGEFSGKFHRALKAGHMPGSINVEWNRALRRDGTLKNAIQLEKLYPGIAQEKETVTYCQSGYRAAHSWLVLRLLGFRKVRNYLGSWYEWGNDPQTSVVR